MKSWVQHLALKIHTLTNRQTHPWSGMPASWWTWHYGINSVSPCLFKYALWYFHCKIHVTHCIKETKEVGPPVVSLVIRNILKLWTRSQLLGELVSPAMTWIVPLRPGGGWGGSWMVPFPAGGGLGRLSWLGGFHTNNEALATKLLLTVGLLKKNPEDWISAWFLFLPTR